MDKLTDRQLAYLRWIDANRIVGASWLANGRLAHGAPEGWDQHRLRSKDGTFTVATEDHVACLPYTTVGNIEAGDGLYVLNEAGRSALASQKKVDGRG